MKYGWRVQTVADRTLCTCTLVVGPNSFVTHDDLRTCISVLRTYAYTENHSSCSGYPKSCASSSSTWLSGARGLKQREGSTSELKHSTLHARSQPCNLRAGPCTRLSIPSFADPPRCPLTLRPFPYAPPILTPRNAVPSPHPPF